MSLYYANISKTCKKLLVYVEIDRCATDAIRAVTGCSLGKRTLKFLDYGKMAATFVNLETKTAVRVAAKDEARSRAFSYADNTCAQHEAEKRAYALMPEESLFSIQPMEIQIPMEDMPGARGGRVCCQRCGEGINFKREIRIKGQILCIPCSRGSYLPINRTEEDLRSPKVLIITGPSGSGKTTLIEKLVPELSQRGYRIGTVKHHHSHSPAEVDCVGKDSWRHRKAGAKAVVLISPSELALFKDTDQRASLDEAIAYLDGVDLVLVEGFQAESRPSIRVGKLLESSPKALEEEDLLFALVSREKSGQGIPCFSPEEIPSLANLIEKEFLRHHEPEL